MQKNKIVFLDTKTLGNVPNLDIFSKLGKYVKYENTASSLRVERINDANIVITNKVFIDQEVMDLCPNIKLICVAATGINNIDLGYAEKKGITVKNVSDYSTESVAQYTFTMILYLLSAPTYYNNYVQSGRYEKNDIFTHIGVNFWQLSGKRFGIIGMGNIGRRVATIAKSFGCEVVYYSSSGKNKKQPYTMLTLDELLKTSDIVSIHAPLNEHTKNLLDYEKMQLMKHSALLINMGRGGIINEHDLARIIDEERIAGAGTDVFTQEPVKPDNPLMHINNKERLIATPHIAWASIEARMLLIEKIYDNIQSFISN